MASLDSLSTFGTELTTEHLNTVDGGVVIAGLVVLNMIIWGANGAVWIVKNT